jgi:hypothetical protein
MKLLLIAALLLTGAVVCAAQTQTPKPDDVVAHLSKTEVFAFGGVGFAGTTSGGEKDFKTILSRPTALADFETVFSSGNAMAKAYALVGIRDLKPERFQALAASVRDSKEKVVTMHGCIMDRETFAAIIKQIDAGQYSLHTLAGTK